MPGVRVAAHGFWGCCNSAQGEVPRTSQLCFFNKPGEAAVLLCVLPAGYPLPLSALIALAVLGQMWSPQLHGPPEPPAHQCSTTSTASASQETGTCLLAVC